MSWSRTLSAEVVNLYTSLIDTSLSAFNIA